MWMDATGSSRTVNQMQRLTPGPFGGFFDDIDYASPVFFPVVVTCILLLFTWVAMIWALLRRARRSNMRREPRGFQVITRIKTGDGDP